MDTNNTDPVRAQDYVAVPRAFLEQVYGMAREGCEAPAAAYRWCERIDGLFHGGSLDEHDEWARQLPDALASAPQQLAAVDGKVMVQASDLKTLAEFADRGMRGNPAKLAALRAKAILAAQQQG